MCYLSDLYGIVLRMDLARFDSVLKHVWLEPKSVAQFEWRRDHPGPGMQLMNQIGRGAMEQFAAGGGWPDPDATVSFVEYDEPDWDWWEPRYDTPGRREAARDAAFDARFR